MGCLVSKAFCDAVDIRPWRIFQPISKAKTILSSWRRVVKLVGRRYNLASSGQISFASSEIGIDKAIVG